MAVEFATIVEDLQERLRPLKARLFPRQVLIELGDAGLKGQVLADGRPGNVRFEAPLPPLTCRGGMPLEREPIGDLIGDLMVRDKLMEAFVMAALPPAAVTLRLIEWPAGEPVPEDPIEALREYQGSSLRLPFQLSEAVLDICPLPGSGSRAILAASPRPLIEAWIQVFNHAGARLERLAPAQSCCFLALTSHLVGVSSRDLVVLVAPGPDETRLLMLRDGAPRFDRPIANNGTQLVEDALSSIRFYRRADPEVGSIRLMHSAPIPEIQTLAEALSVDAESIASAPFDSLVMEGLAVPEAAT